MSLSDCFGLEILGLPYSGTRHNLGFDLVDALACKWQFSWKLDKKVDSEVAEGVFLDRKLVLLKPQTFMNLSGVSLQKILKILSSTSKHSFSSLR